MLESLNPSAVYNDSAFLIGVRNENGPRTLGRQWQIIDAGAVPVTNTGNTNNTPLRVVTVPGGMLGPDGMLKVTATYSANNNANTKTPRVRLGASSLFSAGLNAWTTLTVHLMLWARASETSQVCTPINVGNIWGSSAQAVVLTTFDMRQDQTISIDSQLANAADTMTLEAWCVELLPS